MKKIHDFYGLPLPCGKILPKGILVLPQEVSTLFKHEQNIRYEAEKLGLTGF